MQTVNSNASAVLCREVLSEANRRRDEILQRARSEAGQLLAEAQARVDRMRQERLTAAQAEASRRAQAILASIAVESNRRRSEQLEECIRTIHDGIVKALRSLDGPEYCQAVLQAIASALPQFRGETVVMRISPERVGFLGNGLEKEIRLHSERSFSGLEIRTDPTLPDREAILQDRPGHQLWNLGLEARLGRSWPELRRQIAALLISPVHSRKQAISP